MRKIKIDTLIGILQELKNSGENYIDEDGNIFDENENRIPTIEYILKEHSEDYYYFY